MVSFLTVLSFCCIIIGLAGLVWNVTSTRDFQEPHPTAPRRGSPARGHRADKKDDRILYGRAVALIRDNRVVDGARILEELGLVREASTVLERKGMIHESAAVFLRRKRYHRAGEVYARHKMYNSAGQCYWLAADSDPTAIPGPDLLPPRKNQGPAIANPGGKPTHTPDEGSGLFSGTGFHSAS